MRIGLFSLAAEISFHEQELPHGNEVARHHPVEVHAAGERRGIQSHLVVAGRFHLVDQSRYLLTQYIVEFKQHVCIGRQLKTYGRCRIERVGSVPLHN